MREVRTLVGVNNCSESLRILQSHTTCQDFNLSYISEGKSHTHIKDILRTKHVCLFSSPFVFVSNSICLESVVELLSGIECKSILPLSNVLMGLLWYFLLIACIKTPLKRPFVCEHDMPTQWWVMLIQHLRGYSNINLTFGERLYLLGCSVCSLLCSQTPDGLQRRDLGSLL